MELEPTMSGDVGPLGPTDDIEKIKRVAHQAITEGREADGILHASIPVDESMTYWGTSIWHFTEDGRMVRANDLISEVVSGAVGRNVRISGYGQRMNPETGELESRLHATISDPSNE